MYQSFELCSGVFLRYLHSSRFKQGVITIQFVRPMDRQEASMNAILPEILLRGCRQYPDLRQITLHLDDLYGAAVSGQVRRVGDYQTVGLGCAFMEDRFALQGDQILAPALDFLGQLLLQPVTEKGVFAREFISGEKRNMISALESTRNDKAAYASNQLLKTMCRGDSYSIPRLGTIPQVKKITAPKLWDHYGKVLRESPVEIFYVGSAPMEQVADLLRPVFASLQRNVEALPPQTALQVGKPGRKTEMMDIAQAKVALGLVTPITNRDDRFAAMQVLNTVFGGGMNSKLFAKVREEKGLCYSVGSGYYGGKGIVTVHAGVENARCEEAEAAILAQLDACKMGQITPAELAAAKNAMLSGLRAVYDSPGAMERYFSANALSGVEMTPEQHAEKIRAVTVADLVEAASAVQMHAAFFLKGAAK